MQTAAWPPGHDFWTNTLPAATNGMKTPHLFKGLIPETAADAAAVLDGFASLRRAHTQGTQVSAGARIYIGEDLRQDRLPTVLSAADWPEGGFVDWMQNLVGEERFSLVLNTLESLSPRLAAGLGQFVDAVMSGWGVPVGGAEMIAFIGNYAGTAFGVHEGYEDAFLTHYGPGAKDFYCWPQDEYQKLTGGTDATFGDYTWLLEHAEHYRLEPGDALFLPERVFHVGRQDEFSISVAVGLYTFSDAAVVREFILPDLFEGLLPNDPDAELGKSSPMEPLAGGGGQLAQRLSELTTATLTSALAQADAAAAGHVLQRWNTILSNGGWQLVDGDLGRDEAAAAFSPDQVTPGARATVTAPYRLMTVDGKAFLRGCEVAIDPQALTPGLSDALNAGAVVLPADDRVLAAVRALGATGGLTITPALADKEHSPS